MKKKNESVLIIADTQFPYDHPDYLRFCKAVNKKYRCKRQVHIGDIADCMNFSGYEKSPSAPSTMEEVKELKEKFKKWGKAFPKVQCVVGNHDNRIRRKLDTAGFPEELLSTEHIFRNVFDLPKGWSLHDKVILKTTTYGEVHCLHGDEKGSSVVAGQTARTIATSIIRGHHHSRAFLFYVSTPHKLMFDMIVGCGINKFAKAFDYNKKDMARPILACGVMDKGTPLLIPMQLNSKHRWTGKL